MYIHRQPGRQIDKTIERDTQIGRHTEMDIYIETDRQTDRETDRQTDRQTDGQTDRQTDRQTGR
jgi:hypothetical protein